MKNEHTGSTFDDFLREEGILDEVRRRVSRKLDKIVVVDIEATCWRGNPPPNQQSDIIEIGVCLLDTRTFERSDKRSILVRPERSMVSEFCTELTTLTQQVVDEGVSLYDACEILRKDYKSRDRIWASFGDYDRKQFERSCSGLGVDYPFGRTHWDVKTLFAVTQGLKKCIGMSRALKELGIKLEGTHHRGHDDAWNIAAILGRILERNRSAMTATS